ncbi:MAG: KamA family radical SAM protein [Candidatus Omnitrophica bacterium]|nr:KamA family radical SAM protein [Candidatus Omnitrophota bacterium]
MNWHEKLEHNICTISQLKKYSKLSTQEEKRLQKVIERHPMSVTQYYASLIDWHNPNDPIRRMVVPDVEELNIAGSYDTSGERENTKMPGLQHKYEQTALILTTNRCPAYCRYCFRKRLVGLPTREILHRFEDAVDYVKRHKEINNVLLSGGDPFVLPVPILEKFLEQLSKIKHLEFIRFGTRTPVTFPDRILSDRELRKLLKKYSRKNRRIYIVTQFNHPREITSKSMRAVDMLLNSGVILNNQTVLLKYVNDRPHTLAELQNKLVRTGVNPYYVFQCRPVKRVKYRFQDTLYRGYYIVEGAKKILNGHSKRFKYVMSHITGKIEIVGIVGADIYFKYHQAKNPKDSGKFFRRRLNKSAGWLDELSEHRFLSSILQETMRILFP